MAWTSRIAILACALIVISCVYVYYDLNGESFALSDRQVILVVTDSMDGDVIGFEIDSFPANTLVMVEHLSEQEKRFLRVGDVVSYKDGREYVQHRVVKVNSGSVYVHGDNNHSTEIVSFENINGKVVGTSPWMGSIVVFIQGNHILFLGAMFAICASLILFGVFSPTPKKGGRLI